MNFIDSSRYIRIKETDFRNSITFMIVTGLHALLQRILGWLRYFFVYKYTAAANDTNANSTEAYITFLELLSRDATDS